MLCAVCVELKLEHAQDSVTMIDGTCFCYDHVQQYLESKAKRLQSVRDMQAVIESLKVDTGA